MFAVLSELWANANRVNRLTVVHGAARGADRMAGEWARSRREEGVIELPFPADWRRYGRAAGVLRNQRMLDEGKPDLVLAFHDDIDHSRGTKDMVRRARGAQIEVRVFTSTPPAHP